MPVTGETDNNKTNSVTHILSSKHCCSISNLKHILSLISLVSKEILEIKALNQNANCFSEEGMIGNVVPSKSSEEVSDDALGASDVSSADAQNIGRGRWYNMKELEMATHGFVEENVVGEGGYGVVFYDVLQHGSIVIVKIFLNKYGFSGEDEKGVE
ncbi:hypothetical protein GQ457_05G028610 [Hibiscus cannabinus]